MEITDINWKQDRITERYVEENRELLAAHEKMTPSQLATTITYCASWINPYSEELIRKAGHNKPAPVYWTEEEEHEYGKYVKAAAKQFGITIY